MTTNQLSEFNLTLNMFDYISKNGINDNLEKWILENLPNSLSFFTHLIIYAKFDTIERITINKNILKSNKRIKDIKFLKYPPSEFVNKYGRCNMRKESVLYASPIFMTAMNEMRPKIGDLITKSKWKLKTKHTLKLCPIFHIQPKNGTFNPRTRELKESFDELLEQNFPNENQKEAVRNLTEFIAFHFSKYVSSDNDKDYIFSAYFSHKILNEFENGTVEGIYYPSVKENLSFENLALKPEIFDKHYELCEVHESVVVSDLSISNGYMMKAISDCEKFNYSTNEILWDYSKFSQPDDELKKLKEEFDLDLE